MIRRPIRRSVHQFASAVTRAAGEDGFYNRRLVRLGYATHLEVPPNDAYADVILADERAARSSGAGLWGACAR